MGKLELLIARLNDDVSVRDQENSYLARKIQKDSAKITDLQKKLASVKQPELVTKTLIETEYEYASKYFK